VLARPVLAQMVLAQMVLAQMVLAQMVLACQTGRPRATRTSRKTRCSRPARHRNCCKN